MDKVCKWCDSPIPPSNDGRFKFCSVRCRDEYHSINFKRSPFYRVGRKREDYLSNPNSFVKCEECGKIMRRKLDGHLLRQHGIAWSDYKKVFPNARNNCIEISNYISAKQTGEKNWMYGISPEKHHSFRGSGWLCMKIQAIKIRGYKCEMCGYDKHKEVIEAHHKIPRKLGGKNTLDNIQLLCANCHRLQTTTKIHRRLQVMI